MTINQGFLDHLIEILPDAIIVVDKTFHIVFANTAVYKILGYQAEELIGKPLDCLIPQNYRGQHTHQVAEYRIHGLPKQISERPVLRALNKEGQPVPVTIALSNLDHEGERYSVAVVRDASKISGQIDYIIHQSEIDSLTKLGNRSLLTRYINESITANERFTLLFLDLRKFKPFNDKYGHQIGDEVLITIAKRLKAQVRANDIAARIGGDEFVLLLKTPHDERLLKQRAAEISDTLQQPFKIGDIDGTIKVNIGAAIHPDDGKTEAELLEVADRRMYKAKQAELSYCISDN